jgi:hypothetical protein
MFVHSRSLDTAILVHVWIPFRHNGMERKEQARIYRKLYGYRSSSNYGKYHYDVKGILDSVPSIRYEDGNFIVREEDFPVIKKFLEENGSSYRTWKVIPDEEEVKKLKLHST